MREPSPSTALDLQVIVEPIPRAAVLAAWWNSWAAGRSAADDFLDVMALFGTHVLLGRDGEQVPLLIGLAGLRPANGDVIVRAVLPVAGDPAGLPGPPAMNRRAIAAGQAVVFDSAGVALIPSIAGDVTSWHVCEIDPHRRAAPPVRPEEAAASVRTALLDATTELTSLDIARDRDAVADSLKELDKELRKLRLPRSLPGTHAHTAHTAARVLGIVAIAGADDNSSLTIAQRDDRVRVLGNLARTARHCLAAACSASAR